MSQTGIEPTSPGYEPGILPLNYRDCDGTRNRTEICTMQISFLNLRDFQLSHCRQIYMNIIPYIHYLHTTSNFNQGITPPGIEPGS